MNAMPTTPESKVQAYSYRDLSRLPLEINAVVPCWVTLEDYRRLERGLLTDLEWHQRDRAVLLSKLSKARERIEVITGIDHPGLTVDGLAASRPCRTDWDKAQTPPDSPPLSPNPTLTALSSLQDLVRGVCERLDDILAQLKQSS